MIQDRSFMRGLCGPDYQDKISKPFPAIGFDCASNGHALLMLTGETFPARPCPDVAELVCKAPPSERDCDFQSLKQWALSAGAYFKACGECLGSLRKPCDHCGQEMDCDECNGSGKLLSGVVGGMLYGVFVNRCLLGMYLEHLEAQRVTVRTQGDLDPIWIEDGSNWRLILMPMRTRDAAKLNGGVPFP